VIATEASDLFEWLERHIYPLEASFQDPQKAKHVARSFFAELSRSGTTTCSALTTIHEEGTRMAFREARDAGLRVIMGKVMMDRNCPRELKEETDVSLSQSETLCSEWNGSADGRLMYSFTPRFAVTC